LPSIVFVVAKPIVGMPKKLITLGDHIKKKRLEENLFQKDIGKVIGTDNFTINFLGIPTIGFATTNTMEGNKAQKPCPCGFYGDGTSKCHCTTQPLLNFGKVGKGNLLKKTLKKLVLFDF
jgi:hypothetical protein